MRFIPSALALLGLLSPAFGQSPIVGWNLRGADAVFTSNTATFVTSYVQTTAPANAALYGMDFDASATTLWAVENATLEYGTLDIATGAYTALGFTNLPGITGLTAAADGSTWYAADYDGVGGVSNLFVGDVTTGVFTLVGPIGAGIHIDISIDSNGNLYSHSISDDSLYSVNTTTGAGTLIGPTGLAANFAQGMDFDWTDDTLWATIYTGGGTGMFVSLDLTSGAPLTMEDTTPLNAEMEIAVQVPAPPTSGRLGTLDPSCTPLSNSTGQVGLIELIGTGLALDPIAGTATQGPPAAFGYFISGPNPGQYTVPPGSMGILCIGNPQYRYNSVPLGQVFQFDAGGVSGAVSGGGASDLPTDGSYAPVPAVAIGDTRAFQAWYRDGTSSNFTESKIVMFQ